MAVKVFSNNLPDPKVRAAVEAAVLSAIGSPTGDWIVQIHENQNSPSWHVTIWGPNNFQWTREFFGPQEQNAIDGFRFIKEAIAGAFRRSRPLVYLSFSYPDNKDGFVNQLRDLLADELQLQTGEPADVTLDMERMRPGTGWRDEVQDLINNATVLVPVISPSYFKSEWCRKEFEIFLGREQRAGQPLIFPVYFATAAEVENASHQLESTWVQTAMRHRYLDLRKYRFDIASAKARRAVVSLVTSIREASARGGTEKRISVELNSTRDTELQEGIYVRSLRLENFRCFDRLELRFDRSSSLEGRWTCIAGINGSGKSTILQALGLALLGNPLALELGGERLNRMRRKADLLNRNRAKVEIELIAATSGETYRLNLAIEEGRIINLEEPSFSPPVANRIRRLLIAGYGASRNLSAHIDSANEHLSPDVRHQISLFDPLSQLSGAEGLVKQNAESWPFLMLFRNAAQQVFDTDLQVILGSPFSGIQFASSQEDYVDAIDLPDGFRSAAAWLADLCSIWCEKAPEVAMNANPADICGIVLIDEIDLHLHPSLQRTLVPRLRKVFPKVQWIITTHSPLVLANFDVNELIALDRNREGNIRELDRQILGFTSDEIYEWLMGTRPMGAELSEELQKSDEGTGKSPEELASLMRESPVTSKQTAEEQTAQFKEILKALKR